MKNIFTTTLAVALLAMPLAAANLNAGADATVVARGKGIVITQREIDQVLANARLKNPEDQLPPDADFRAFTHLLEIQLVMQKATESEVAAGKIKNDINFTNIMNTLGPQEFQRRLKATGMTPDELRQMLFQEDTAQTSLTRQLAIAVTDADAQKFYEANSGAYDQPEKARVRELLLLTTSDFTTSAAPPLPAATIAAKHKLILELRQRVQAGEDLKTLTTRYNEDPLSKANAGELVFRQEQMEFGDLAFSMKPGQMSEVITNDEGYRFFQLLEKIPARKATFAEVASRIKNGMTGQQKQMRAPVYIQQLRQEAGVEILDKKLKAEAAANEAEAANAAAARSAYMAKLAAEATNAPARKP